MEGLMGSTILGMEGIVRYPHSGKLTSQAGKRIMSCLNVYICPYDVWIYLKMSFLVKMGMFQAAMLLAFRCTSNVSWFFGPNGLPSLVRSNSLSLWIGSAQSEEDFWIQKNKFHGMVSWIVDGDDGEDGGTLVGTKVVGTKQISSFLKLLVGWFGFVSDDGDGWGWMGIQNGSWLIAIFCFTNFNFFTIRRLLGIKFLQEKIQQHVGMAFDDVLDGIYFVGFRNVVFIGGCAKMDLKF